MKMNFESFSVAKKTQRQAYKQEHGKGTQWND